MKALGFPNLHIAVLVLAESILLCMVGAVAGITVASFVIPGLNADLGSFIGAFELTRTSVTGALLVALVLGLCIGIPPALAASRLSIVAALRKE